jgi:hypothetical protein
MNQKAMMQLALSFNNISLLNNLNCKKCRDIPIGQPERPTHGGNSEGIQAGRHHGQNEN